VDLFQVRRELMKIFRCIIMLEKITVETIDSLAFLLLLYRVSQKKCLLVIENYV